MSSSRQKTPLQALPPPEYARVNGDAISVTVEDEDGKRVDERAALLGAGKKARADRAENRSTAGSLSLSTASTDWNDVDPENAVSSVSAYFTLVTSFLGAGFLALPFATLSLGLWASLVALALLGVFARYTCWLIIQADHVTPGIPIVNVIDIGRAAFGKTGAIITYVAVVLCQFGFCCAYVIFVSDNLHSIFPALSVTLWTAILAVPFIGLAWLRSLRFLAPTSVLGPACVLLVTGVVFYTGFAIEGIGELSEYEVFVPAGASVFWGIGAFSYCCHNLVLPTKRSMKNPHMFGSVLTAAFVTMFCAYLLFGSCGYLFFRESTNSVITLNLPDDWIATVVKLAICVALLCAFPVQLFPVFVVLEPAIFPLKENADGFDPVLSPKPDKFRWIKINVFRALMVVVISAIALSIPLFGYFSSFVGAFSVGSMMFILPLAFYIKLNYKRMSRWSIFGNSVLLLIAVVGCAASSVVDVYSIIQAIERLHSSSASGSQSQ